MKWKWKDIRKKVKTKEGIFPLPGILLTKKNNNSVRDNLDQRKPWSEAQPLAEEGGARHAAKVSKAQEKQVWPLWEVKYSVPESPAQR